MRQRALIGALGLVLIGVVLGATMFRSDIAQATGLAQAVTVSNTPAQAVPVREQNLDGSNIRVHEQGTAQVSGTVGLSGSANTVKIDTQNNAVAATIPPATATGAQFFVEPAGHSADFFLRNDHAVVNISFLQIKMDASTVEMGLNLDLGPGEGFRFPGPDGGGQAIYTIPLAQPIPLNKVWIMCGAAVCEAEFSWAGTLASS